jgi:hypothetical protein
LKTTVMGRIAPSAFPDGGHCPFGQLRLLMVPGTDRLKLSLKLYHGPDWLLGRPPALPGLRIGRYCPGRGGGR